MKNLLILLLVLLTSSAFGQLEAKIDSLFSEYNNSPGCAIGVYSKGELLYKKGYGIANLDYDIAITPETVFDIGSVSKQFTAACIVLLENEGKLSLDDDIRKYIPELPSYDEGKITIRNLLHHTSGLRDYLTLMYLSGISYDDYFTEQMGLDILTRQKELNFKPGTEELYSNSGYLVLAIIIRRVSGESIGAFAQKNIFDPLEMKNTFIYEDGAKVVKNRAIGYSKEKEEYVREHHFDFVVGGDGQVYTTVEDFFKWSENFKSNKLGNDTFLKQMLTKGVLSSGDTLDYALGLSHGFFKSLKTISHGGAWGGFRAYYLQFPEEDLAIAVMGNLGSLSTGQKARQIAEIMLKDKLENKESKSKKETAIAEIPKTEFLFTQLVGKYEIEPGVEFNIIVKNDSLNITQLWNQESYNINRTIGNTFHIPDEDNISFTFTDLNNNFSQKITVIQNGRETVCKRKKEFDGTNIKIKEYAAKYYCEELDATYQVFIEEGMLKTKFENNEAITLSMYAIDQLTCDLGLLRFKRNDAKISGFEIDAGRVKNLKFVKL